MITSGERTAAIRRRPAMRLATFLAVVGLAGVARADDRTLHLAVHGSLDADQMAKALASELGVAVDVAGGACNVPCLDIAVDGQNTATILFSPRSGGSRSRSVALGTDTTQWPLVITLLAGNVVRDEAQDVLAGLPGDLDAPSPEANPGDVPAPPADAPPPIARPVRVTAVPVPVVAAVDEPREHSFVSIGFVPVLSTDLTHVGSVEHFLSFNALVGVSGGSSGFAASGLVDVQQGVVGGVQFAGISSIARRVSGTQAGGIAAVAGDVDGVQAAGIASAADHVTGVQAGGIAAIARSSADLQLAGIAAVTHHAAGSQFAGIAAVSGAGASVQGGGIAAVAHGDANIQAAGIASVATGDANVQAAGITNVARGNANIQVAGLVNVAGQAHGVQLAPINVSHGGDGLQVGVINVGGSPEGFSFGLINIVPGGRYDLESAVDSSKMGTILFRHGGRRWHNVYGVGGHPVDRSDSSRSGNDDVWMYGLGFGPSIQLGDDNVIDLEAIAWQVNHGPSHESDLSLLAQGRLSVTHYWGPFGIVAGVVYNTYITDDHMSPLLLERRATRTPTSPSTPDRSTTVERWPSAFIGIRI
jgi:hypothetical protein